MRFFKQHPALAALLVLVLIGIAAPVAYAIANNVYLWIDSSKSESEIEADVQEQLAAAGHDNATVTAKKSDHELSVEIASDDPSLGNLDLELAGPDGKTYRIHLVIPPTLPEAQQKAVGEAASKAVQRPNNETDAQLEQSVRADLASHGITDVEVRISGTSISIVVK
jgi:hypothetical protein